MQHRIVCLAIVAVIASTSQAATDAALGYGDRGFTLPIPDNDAAGVTYSINVPDHFRIADLNVEIFIYHTYIGDLEIWLEDPAGERIDLFSRGCRDTEDLITIFDDEGLLVADCELLPMRSIAPAFNTSVSPGAVLSRLDGKDAHGTWRIRVADVASNDTGRLNSAVLLFQEDTALAEVEAAQAGIDSLTLEMADVAASVDTVEGKVDSLQTDLAIVKGRLLSLQVSVDQVQADVTAIGDQLTLQDQLEIETALINREFTSMLTAPAPLGKLEQVRDVVLDAIGTMQAIGQSTLNAETLYETAERDRLAGRYRKALRRYATAFCVAVSETNEVSRCY